MAEKIVSYLAWGYSYMVNGVICIAIGIIYLIFVFKDIRSITPKLPGYKKSQTFFVFAILIRGVGWTVQAILYFLEKEEYISLVSPITIGLPGYILTISYVLLFYLWSSICLNLISNDSQGYAKAYKNAVNVSLSIIVVSGIILICLTVYQLFKKPNDHFIHYTEGIVAALRDFVVGSIIFDKILKLIMLSGKPLCSFKYNESIYCLMLLCISIALFIRCISIMIFLMILKTKKVGTILDYWNTFITAIISEIFPCFIILITRKRSGLLSVYEII